MSPARTYQTFAPSVTPATQFPALPYTVVQRNSGTATFSSTNRGTAVGLADACDAVDSTGLGAPATKDTLAGKGRGSTVPLTTCFSAATSLPGRFAPRSSARRSSPSTILTINFWRSLQSRRTSSSIAATSPTSPWSAADAIISRSATLGQPSTESPSANAFVGELAVQAAIPTYSTSLANISRRTFRGFPLALRFPVFRISITSLSLSSDSAAESSSRPRRSLTDWLFALDAKLFRTSSCHAHAHDEERKPRTTKNRYRPHTQRRATQVQEFAQIRRMQPRRPCA